MIANPRHGWCDFKIGSFKGTPSYLTDVPSDLMNAFISYYKNGYCMAWFDEEGTEFSLVLTPYSIFVIEEKDDVTLHNFSEMLVDKLAHELIADIENDIDEWAIWSVEDSPGARHWHRSLIKQKLLELKRLSCYMEK